MDSEAMATDKEEAVTNWEVLTVSEVATTVSVTEGMQSATEVSVVAKERLCLFPHGSRRDPILLAERFECRRRASLSSWI